MLSLNLFAQDEDDDNPHKEMLRSQFTCLDCHTDVPKEGETSPTYFLFDLPSENCLGCHSDIEHAGVTEHLGKDSKPLPGDENGKIACFSCHDPHPEGAIKGRVVHEANVNKRTREFINIVVLPSVEKRLGKEEKMSSAPYKEVRLRYPVTKNQLCEKCHGDRKEKNWRTKVLWDKYTNIFSY